MTLAHESSNPIPDASPAPPTAPAAAVRDHYQAAIPDARAWLHQLDQVLQKLEPPLDARRLAPLDQFHVGGLAATVELARRAGAGPGQRVLDAGAGLGGGARYLAQACGCEVDAVDLAPHYVAAAERLTALTGLSARVRNRVGDLTALPDADQSFDLVWSQHVSMNIADRGALYRELRRVLRHGGRFAFYDPIAADGDAAPLYPLPWAETAASSTLLTLDQTRAALAQAGLAPVQIEDVTALVMGWMSQPPPVTPGAANLAQVMGPRMAQMGSNFARSLREGRLRLVMGVCQAV